MARKFIVFVLSGCGGNESTLQTAYFVDSRVQGLAYISDSQKGVTEVDGKLQYSTADQSIEFKVGAVSLGTIAVANINPDGRIFIQDLVGVDRLLIDDPRVLKIATLLQSLNSGSNPEGITLDQDDLDQLTEEIEITTADLSTLLDALQKAQKTEEQVKQHLKETLSSEGLSFNNYAPQAFDSNITTLKNVSTQGNVHATDKNDKFLTYSIESNVTHGKLEFIVDSNSFKYTPDQDYVGSDEFIYKAYDGEKYSVAATVSISVQELVVINPVDVTAPTQAITVSLDAQQKNITLFWLGSTDDLTPKSEIRYEIYLSQDEGFNIDSLTPQKTVVNTLEADIDALNSDTLYYIKIKALDLSGNSSISEQSSIKTPLEVFSAVANVVVKKAIDLHLENAQAIDDTIIFSDSSHATLPNVSDVLIGNSDDAYLKKVLAVNRINDAVELTVEDIAITDIIDTVELSSKTILFRANDADITSRPITRGVVYRSNNTKEAVTSWGSGRFSVSETKNIPVSVINKRSTTKSNSEFEVTIVKDNITVIKNQTLQIDINAVMKQAGIDDEWKFKYGAIELISVTHPDKSSSNNFGAWYSTTKLTQTEASGYLKWTPNSKKISTEPYIAKFQVFAKDENCTETWDLCDSDTEIIEARIIVIGDGKVETGGETTTSFGTNSEFSNDITLDFTPTLVIDHKIEGRKVKHVKVEVSGELDFNVLSKFKYSATASKEYKTAIITPITYKSVYMAGPVPIYQEITFTIDAELSAVAEGSIEATSDLTSNFMLAAGIEYNGTSWTPIKRDSITKDYTATIEAAGGVKVDVRLIPNVEVKFYKVASAGISVEPWLDGSLKASATAIYNTDFQESDALGLHRVEELLLDVGVEGKVYADLTIWKLNLAHYPSEGGKKTIFNATAHIFSIPSISLQDNSVDLCSSSPYIVKATINNPETLVKNDFDLNSIRWVIFPESGASIVAQAGSSLEASFTFSKQDEYTVYMMGNSEKLGNVFGSQYESFNIDTRNCELDSTVPVITLNGSASISLKVGDTYTELGATATDNVDGTLTVSTVGTVYTNNAGNYTITYTATDAAGNVASVTRGITVTIGAVSSISISSSSITEGNTGASTLTFTLTLNQFNTAASVDYATSDGTATAGTDYIAKTGTVNFTGGSTSETISITINGDTDVEANETFTLTLSNSANLNISATTAIGTISNDDSSAASGKLNDTGITWSGNYLDGNNTTCVGTEVYKQDCSYGRDSLGQALSKIGSGAVGFDFTKLDGNGNTMPATGDGIWSCVKDNHTGLIWEVKTTDGGIHDAGNTYRWGGLTAQGRDHVSKEGIYYDDWNALVDDSNNNSLCGFNSGWRVPSRHELRSIVHLGRYNPTIETGYFPNISTYTVWSSSPYTNNLVNAWTISFSSGGTYAKFRGINGSVRLVHSSQ